MSPQIAVRWHSEESTGDFTFSNPIVCPARELVDGQGRSHVFERIGGGQKKCRHCGALRQIETRIVEAPNA